MADFILLLGIAVGLAAAFFAYRKKKKIWLALMWFVIGMLGIGTVAHCLIVPALLAVFANKLLFKWLRKNWAAFLVSLLGVFLVIFLLSKTGWLYLTLQVEGPVGLGEALGAGIAMGLGFIFFILAGILSYFAATSVTSILRWRK